MASGAGTISGQTLTTTGIGRIAVIATSGTFTADTTHISSVPTGMLAASTGNGIAVFNFDGSGMRRIAINQQVGNVRWAPSGAQLVFDQNSGGCSGNTNIVQTTDLEGGVTVINTGPASDMYLSYSRDGQWIYFTSNNGGGATLWRVHPDGTSGDTLNSQNPSFDLYPSPRACSR